MDNNNDIIELLDILYGMVTEAWGVPLGNDKCIIEREKAVEIGVRRHAGRVTDIFGPSGKKQVVRGKDLSAVRWVVATGGALTRVPGGEATLRRICTGPGAYLLPEPTAHVLIDANYLFSALGTLAQSYPDEVRETFRRWALAVVPDAVPHPLTPPDHGSDHA